MFYLFYMGYSASGRISVGLATSNDGVSFKKFESNPVIAPDNNGFDAFTAGPGKILMDDSVCVMYYNGQELAGFSPGKSVGRATALIPTGPWKRSETPVLSSGSKGEWDAGFIIPSSVLKLDDGIYRMYYLGGTEITAWKDFYIGLAISEDGINWKKYNDPSTTQHPFAESDPVLMNGDKDAWDDAYIWIADVTNSPEGFGMYYTGAGSKANDEELAIGYAESKDGIHWEKYSRNPLYRAKDDPVLKREGGIKKVENPSVLFLDTITLLYYDYGSSINEKNWIGLARVRVH
jgi:sucrose-6-phosphate hydrolase SacC (GH32 family)